MQTGIQLFTLRTLEESLTETIARVGETVFEGVEFAGLGESSPGEVATALEDAGLTAASAHVGIDDLEGDLGETVATYETLGCADVVVPYLDTGYFESVSAARETGRRVAGLAEQYANEGFRLHYHNHAGEFVSLDDRTGFDVFASAADGVALEVDTGLANHAGVDPVPLLDRYADRVSLVHLTDSRRGVDDAQHVDLGTGDVDLDACVGACADADVDWLLFEHGLTDDPVATMEAAAERLDDLL